MRPKVKKKLNKSKKYIILTGLCDDVDYKYGVSYPLPLPWVDDGAEFF